MSAKSKAARHTKATDTTQAVDAFMAQLDHPGKPLLEAIRRLMLAADPSIAEGIKWNAPSFRTTEYFATANLRGGPGVRIILHLGAKAIELPPEGIKIDDPAKLLKWLAPDRAMVEFAGHGELEANQSAFSSVVRQWIVHVSP